MLMKNYKPFPKMFDCCIFTLSNSHIFFLINTEQNILK